MAFHETEIFHTINLFFHTYLDHHLLSLAGNFQRLPATKYGKPYRHADHVVLHGIHVLHGPEVHTKRQTIASDRGRAGLRAVF
jgi:hypothetical protein